LPIVPIEDAEELAAALPPDRLRFLRFAHAGHMLAAEQPEAVLGLLREFVLEESEQATVAAATLTA
jgi:proline iminopeptidase